MKTKLFISTFFLISVLMLNFMKSGERETTVPDKGNFNAEVSKKNLSLNEQIKYLDYIISGRIYILECETDYKNIETGRVIIDTSEFGKGAYVVHCAAGTDKPGYCIKNAIIPAVNENKKNMWLNDTAQSWNIKPRIRIKQDLIIPIKENYNEQNFHTPVCRLEIVNTEGKVIKEVEYEAKNFLEKNPVDECRIYYSGNYHEGYGGYLSMDTVIIVNGKEINPKAKQKIGNTKLDYRVYWYGFTDIWIDRLEVKNDAAGELLSGRYDMWINAMGSINNNYIEKIKIMPDQQKCFEYIIEKLKNREFSIR